MVLVEAGSPCANPSDRQSEPPEPAHEVCICITDDGIGIPPAHLPRITELYYRVDHHRPGTGLGLAICKELVSMHGGRLDVSSPPPGMAHGTQVAVRLPLAPPPTVLILGMRTPLHGLLTAPLAACGYRVAIRGDAEDALSALRESSAGILILGVDRAGRDPLATLAAIKVDPDLSRVCVVAVCDVDVPKERGQALQCLGIHCLETPWLDEDLLACLEQA